MKNKISLGMLARYLIREFDIRIKVDADLIKKGYEALEAEGLYKIFKLYVDRNIGADDIAPFIKEIFEENYHMVRKELSERELHPTELGTYFFAKELAQLPQELLSDVLDRSRPVLEHLVEQYEKMKGF